jgi:hypothetical protein
MNRWHVAPTLTLLRFKCALVPRKQRREVASRVSSTELFLLLSVLRLRRRVRVGASIDKVIQ